MIGGFARQTVGLDENQQRAETKQLTHKATLSQPKSGRKQDKSLSLADAIEAHQIHEICSFHTPGHKAIAPFVAAESAWRFDVTELPGLDELASPSGLLLNLEQSAAKLWRSAASFISVNGASAALMAAILACAPRGKKILLPRNAHRSAINALVLSGLEPVWYDPQFNTDWQIWTGVDNSVFAQILQEHAKDLACALVVSPTYSGQSSDITALATLTKKHSLPLIVDEAHGAHRLPDSVMPPSALAMGADLVVHSLHKTLSALTQTGMLHLGEGSLITPQAARASLNLLQSSSPSYLLLVSIERCLADLRSADQLNRMQEYGDFCRQNLAKQKRLELLQTRQEPTHILVRPPAGTAEQLDGYCRSRGVYSETILGNAVLFLIGIGTQLKDVELLVQALTEFAQSEPYAEAGTKAQLNLSADIEFQLNGEQVLSPRDAFFSAGQNIDAEHAPGRIAAECIAPCPPGTPIVVPGQRLSAQSISLCGRPSFRVVIESSIQGEQ